MKRSFLTIAAMSVFALSACGGDAEDTDIEPVDQIDPAPAPAPAPAPLPMDTMTMDTLGADTMTTTGL